MFATWGAVSAISAMLASTQPSASRSVADAEEAIGEHRERVAALERHQPGAFGRRRRGARPVRGCARPRRRSGPRPKPLPLPHPGCSRPGACRRHGARERERFGRRLRHPLRAVEVPHEPGLVEDQVGAQVVAGLGVQRLRAGEQGAELVLAAVARDPRHPGGDLNRARPQPRRPRAVATARGALRRLEQQAIGLVSAHPAHGDVGGLGERPGGAHVVRGEPGRLLEQLLCAGGGASLQRDRARLRDRLERGRLALALGVELGRLREVKGDQLDQLAVTPGGAAPAGRPRRARAGAPARPGSARRSRHRGSAGGGSGRSPAHRVARRPDGGARARPAPRPPVRPAARSGPPPGTVRRAPMPAAGFASRARGERRCARRSSPARCRGGAPRWQPPRSPPRVRSPRRRTGFRRWSPRSDGSAPGRRRRRAAPPAPRSRLRSAAAAPAAGGRRRRRGRAAGRRSRGGRCRSRAGASRAASRSPRAARGSPRRPNARPLPRSPAAARPRAPPVGAARPARAPSRRRPRRRPRARRPAVSAVASAWVAPSCASRADRASRTASAPASPGAPAAARRISASAQNAIPWPYGGLRPIEHRRRRIFGLELAEQLAHQAGLADPRLAGDQDQARLALADGPQVGEPQDLELAAAAEERGRLARSRRRRPSTRQARSGSAKPFAETACGPSSAAVRQAPAARSPTRISPGAAACCSRAAACAGSPVTARSPPPELASTSPDSIPTRSSSPSSASPSRATSSIAAATARSGSSPCDAGDAEYGDDGVADELLDPAAVLLEHRCGRARRTARAGASASSGSRPATSSVEPTRSANTSVASLRSAAPGARGERRRRRRTRASGARHAPHRAQLEPFARPYAHPGSGIL